MISKSRLLKYLLRDHHQKTQEVYGQVGRGRPRIGWPPSGSTTEREQLFLLLLLLLLIKFICSISNTPNSNLESILKLFS